MIYKKLISFESAKTTKNKKNSFPLIKSSIKLDSFLNFSKLSNDSMSSLNSDFMIPKEPSIKYKKPKNCHSSLHKNPKQIQQKEKKFHKHASCVNDINNVLNKKKTALSEFILLNSSTKNDLYYPNIKLLGNSRYKYTSPMMFVEDQKNNMSDINLGLMPIPQERFRKEMTQNEENEREKKLYELQRSIVMLRRKQYNKSSNAKKHRNQFINYNSNSLKDEVDDINDYINKIVIIQKWWGNFSKKNETKNKITKLEKKLRYYVSRKIINELKNKFLVKYQRPLNYICYFDKIRYKLPDQKINNENNLDSIEMENNNKSKMDFNDNNEVNLNYQINENTNSNNEVENFINKNEQNIQKYTSDTFLIFCNSIKKIILSKIISKLINNNNIPPLNILKPKVCFLSIIRKRKIKIKDNINNQKIERIQIQINYKDNKIYKTPVRDSFKNNSEKNFCYISKIRKRNKIQSNESFDKINSNSMILNKNIDNTGFYISKIILKQKNENVIKLQKYIQKKYKEKEKNIIIQKNKIYKQIYKRQCYINKTRKYKYLNLKDNIVKAHKSNLNNNQNNINYFILLLNIFITKNIQDYFFQIIKTKNYNIIEKNKFYIPFYIKAIQRISNYIIKSENPNQKITLFFSEIFNNEQTSTKSILKSLCFLTEEKKNKLINSNIFTGYEENDLIYFLSDFSEFDKNLNNEIFIIERLKKIKLNNTNIFTLVKFIDIEYNNLVKGLYCLKCYNYINSCNCIKEKINRERQYTSGSEIKINDKSDDILDFDFNSNSNDTDDKRQIHCFDYNKNNEENSNILIKTKNKNNENINEKLIDIILPENENKKAK